MGRPRKRFPLSEYPHTKLRNCETCQRLFVPLGAKAKYCTLICNITANTVINHDTGCIEWTGYCVPSGHGQAKLTIREGEGNARIHRYVYEFYHGVIGTDKLVVRHKCDNPACCNIDHLEIGTRADNVADAVERERHPRGSTNGQSKVTEDDVRDIRRSRARGATYAALQLRYGLTFPALSAIIKRRTWRHVK